MGRFEVNNINWKNDKEYYDVLEKVHNYMHTLANKYALKSPYGAEDYVAEAQLKVWQKGRATEGHDGFYKKVICGAMRNFHQSMVKKVRRGEMAYKESLTRGLTEEVEDDL
jgi:DNA-directed RNA polymerase specialized sigma24 family protein